MFQCVNSFAKTRHCWISIFHCEFVAFGGLFCSNLKIADNGLSIFEQNRRKSFFKNWSLVRSFFNPEDTIYVFQVISMDRSQTLKDFPLLIEIIEQVLSFLSVHIWGKFIIRCNKWQTLLTFAKWNTNITLWCKLLKLISMKRCVQEWQGSISQQSEFSAHSNLTILNSYCHNWLPLRLISKIRPWLTVNPRLNYNCGIPGTKTLTQENSQGQPSGLAHTL